MMVEFKMFNPLSFRWQGEFTWVLTGPSIVAVSEPFPMPSTILGALASLNSKVRGRSLGKNYYTTEDVCTLAREVVSDCKAVFRGPYMRCLNNDGLALHLWSQDLMIIKLGSNGIHITHVEGSNSLFTFIKGTALRMNCRSVTPHLIYMQGLLNPQSLTRIGVRPSIIIDTYSGNEVGKDAEIKNVALKLGGEGRVAMLSISNGNYLENTLMKLWGDSWEEEADEILAYVASPVILDSNDRKLLKKLLNNEKVRAGKAVISIPRKNEVRRALQETVNTGGITEDFLKKLRVKITLLSTGFDIVRKSVRPLNLSILPGSIIKIHDSSPKRAFREGVGKYSRCIWGTVIPLIKI